MSTPNYGRDIAWHPRLGLLPGKTVEGVALVAQAQAIRLLTRRASSPGAPDDGCDIRDMLHAEMTRTELARVPGIIRQELLKDDRVRAVDVQLVPDGTSYRLEVNGVCKYGETFRLVTPVGDLTAMEILA